MWRQPQPVNQPARRDQLDMTAQDALDLEAVTRLQVADPSCVERDHAACDDCGNFSIVISTGRLEPSSADRIFYGSGLRSLAVSKGRR